ncbi:TetR/AcrR family transcriptional regulator [Paenibacillus validus]|uniref:TetR/AcrR family transcriptional regulator n=1 Tax=Paenibacillus TaxID=44249 RepID=UPI000FDACDBB|nr:MULTISPECIES: TetR/AcrR family transcriptional regulator [Paenibacillus]MED4603447.1 TetR/AcrR family transcriptional regulator [Paenibacillus validus]MED4609239.1 TetR/AcrR family transcriptional regulator [Paenibacillus validus]
MNTRQISLRELKKARAKLAIYEASLSLIGERSFRDMTVEDVCRKAEVSKVTFFKFFRQKEDLLIYFMRVWLTERLIELEENGKKGFDAIRHLFLHIQRSSAERPGLMLALIGFLSELKMHPCMPELSEAEVQLLFPGNPELGGREPRMDALFERSVREAAEAGELRQGVTPLEAAKVLVTIFYGAYLSAHMFQERDLLAHYERHLSLLGEGGHS